MPEEKDSESTAGKPESEALVEAPVQPTRNKSVPPYPSAGDAATNQSQASDIAKEIKAGEKWLIGIGIATLAINTIIALIYISQLREMRKANDLTRNALGIAAQNSADSFHQFQVQLSHFDAGLGRSDELARHAAEQAGASQDSAMAARDSVRQAREQFIRDQRPYVAETPRSIGIPQFIPNPIHPEQGGQVVWDFHYSNFGKTPAFRFRSDTFMNLGGESFVASYGAPKRKEEIVLPPGTADYYNSVVSAPISKERFDSLMSKDRGIEIKVVLYYQDAYGIRYATGICESHLVLGATQYCKGTYIK